MKLKITILLIALVAFISEGQAQVWTWDTDGDLESWSAANVDAATVQNGSLRMIWSSNAGAPKITLTGLAIPAADYPKFLVRMKVRTGAGETISTSNNCRFVATGSGGNTFMNISDHTTGDDQFKTYIHTVNNGNYTGTLSSLQFQAMRGFTAAVDTVEVTEYRMIRADNTWTGASSSDWNTAGNWSNGIVPTGEIVTIPTGTPSPSISGADAIVANLTLEDGVVVSVTGGNTLTVLGDLLTSGSTGYVTVESGSSLVTYGAVEGTNHVINRTTTFSDATGQYSVVGSPVAGASTAGLGTLVYSYNEAAAFGPGRFVEVLTPETMAGGDAYFSAFTGDVVFMGAPHTGNVDVALTYDAGHGADAGFNLVSNPYPSAIDYEALVTNNTGIDGTVYLWDDGGSDMGQRDDADYITVNMIGEVATAAAGSGRDGDFNGNIGSAQGFFVKANAAAQTLSFNNEMKVAGMNADINYFRKGQEKSAIQSVKVALTSESGFRNESLIGFVDDATVGFDRLYDAYKMDGSNGVQLYSLLNDNAMSIQGLPIEEEMIIPMGIALEESGKYTFSLDFTKDLAEGKVVYLEDTKLNKTINLSELSSYTFSSSVTSGDSRFNLIVSSAAVLSTDDVVNSDLKVMYTRSNITIASQNLNVKNANVSVLDLSGALLFNKAINGLEENTSIDFQFDAHKIYILKVSTSENTLVSKILFN